MLLPFSAVGLLVLLVGTAMTLGPRVARLRAEPLPVFWPVPPFQLTDQQGRPFGSADVAGRAAVYSFIYTNCTDTCPLLTATMAKAQDKLRAKGLLGSKVQMLSVTVDPDRDMPEVLAAYAARFHADPDAWHFLTGEREAVYAVLVGFKLNTLEVARAFARADVIPHSNRFAVVDPQGQVRANLQGDEVSPDDVVDTIERVVP
jgi:cytochrome oxidase Cu insertion factor (SCO1/SenC/PrrC family)